MKGGRGSCIVGRSWKAIGVGGITGVWSSGVSGLNAGGTTGGMTGPLGGGPGVRRIGWNPGGRPSRGGSNCVPRTNNAVSNSYNVRYGKTNSPRGCNPSRFKSFLSWSTRAATPQSSTCQS
jgi:hypothetical protein